MDDPVLRALSGLVPGGIRRGELRRGSRRLRWVESGSGDPAALISSTGGRCVLAGHSWGGLLTQLTARRHPGLVAGLVLVDPSDERLRAVLPEEDRRQIEAVGTVLFDQYARGVLGATIRDMFRPFARRLTTDPQRQALILDAYAWCHAKRSQAQLTYAENQLFTGCIPVLERIRATTALPDVPLTVLSATTGMPAGQRERFTALHADLAATVPGSTHVVLPATGHPIPQERPERVAEAITLVLTDISRRQRR